MTPTIDEITKLKRKKKLEPIFVTTSENVTRTPTFDRLCCVISSVELSSTDWNRHAVRKLSITNTEIMQNSVKANNEKK